MCTVFLTSAYSQGSNSVSGRVVDTATGEPLPGAAIQVENSSEGTVTDLNGNFELAGIMSSQVNIIVSYISYSPSTIACNFSSTDHLNITVRLEPSTTRLQEVKITSQAEGQIKAMLEQQTAVNIKNVVSSEQIEQFPDMNAAEVLQRIPGITLRRDQGEGRFVQLRGTPPELTNFNINGEQIPSPEGGVRYVGLDVISADQIDFIEVTKVLTPDMDADGIGGTVNIITKTARSDKPEIRVTAAGGYNNLRQTPNYQLQFAYGQRYGKFGFQMNASHYVNKQGSDNMEYKYEKSSFWGYSGDDIDNYYVQYREIQLRHYDITRKRTGLTATLDYRFNENSSVYIRGMYNNFSDDETRRRIIYELDDAITETSYRSCGIDRDVKDRIKLQSISTINIGGKHRLWRSMIDYEAAYALASEVQPNRVESEFSNPGKAIFMEFDLSDTDWPRLILHNPIDSVNAFNYEEYTFEELLLLQSRTDDQNLTGKINLELPYFLGSHTGYFKFGGKIRYKEKIRNIDAPVYGRYSTISMTYPGEGEALTLPGIEDGFSETNLLNQSYVIDHTPGSEEIYDFFNYNRQFFTLDRTESKYRSFGEDYTANEAIYAAYGMIRHDINNLMLLAGLRYERTDIDYVGMMVVRTSSGQFDRLDTLTDNRTHEFILPQFHARYRLGSDINFRAGVTYTYSRPNFEDVLPYRAEDRNEVKYGNPDLEFPKSLNIDLLGEKYLQGGGILSGGMFYKNVDDFVFFYKRFGHEGDPSIGNFKLVQVEKALNGNKAFVYGAEVLSHFKLSFLPGFLSNFGLYLNYTYTYSEAYINKRYPANELSEVIVFGENDSGIFGSDTEEEKITMPGQAKHTANLAVFFETEKFYAKITANYHDDFLYQLGIDPDLDEYYDKAWHLDFTAKYMISDHVSVFTDFINLTNAPLKFYLGTPDRILKQEYYSWWGRIGLRLNF
jgi:TonB-dependent receptor